jgi:outer membrane protein assembly factor BamA
VSQRARRASRGTRPLLLFIPFITILTSTTFAAAQSASAPSRPVAADDDANRTDLLDLYRAWRHHPPPTPASAQGPHWTIVPIIASKPSTGFRVGAGADVEFKLGDRQATRFSIMTTSFSFSTRKQVNFSENFRLYGRGNHWIVDGQDQYAGSASDNVAFGTTSTAGLNPDVRYYSLRLFNTFYHRVRGSLYAGAGLYVRRQTGIEPNPEDSPDWTTSPFYVYSVDHGFNVGKQTSGGAGVVVLFDNRDNPSDAVRGWYALSDYRSYWRGFLGGDSSWNEARIDLRTYRALTTAKRERIAVWVFGDFVTSGVAPYLSLPASAGDDLGRSSRGYADGRFRATHLLYSEIEYRRLLTANGVLGMVAFVNATTAAGPDTAEGLFDSIAVAGGAGLRFLIHKQSRTNFCFDIAFGRDGARGIYISLRDAF